MGRGRVAMWVGGAAAVAVATFACGQLVGIGNDPPEGPIAPSPEAAAEGGFTYGQGACATCVATKCDTPMTVCAGNPSCSGLEGCMSGCGTDPTCRAQCGADHGLGYDTATPVFEACLASSCSTACGLTCGGLAAVFPPATAPACEQCLAGGPVCPSVTACATDPECQSAVRCRFSSTTPDVQQACPPIAKDAGTVPVSITGSAPIASSCSTACSWGADWSCVGKVHWPSVTQGSITFDVTVFDLGSTEPVSQAAVKLCSPGDQPCAVPIDSQTTDGAGGVTLVRQPTPLFEYYYLDISSPALVPTLVWALFPISEPRLATNVGTISPSELGYITMGAMVTLDPGLGTLVVYAFDCRLGLAPDVQVTLSPMAPSTQRFYFQNGVPVSTTATDVSGEVAFVNVPVIPTPLTVTVRPQVLDGGVSSTMGPYARDGGLAIVYAVPTP